MADEQDDVIIDATEAMAILKVSRATLTRAIQRGDLAPLPLESSYLQRPRKLEFRKRDVEYLRDNPPNRVAE